MTPEQAALQIPDVINIMWLRGEAGDYYLHCEHWPGRLFIELASGAFLVAEGQDGKPTLHPVEPYRSEPKQPPTAKRRWWSRSKQGQIERAIP